MMTPARNAAPITPRPALCGVDAWQATKTTTAPPIDMVLGVTSFPRLFTKRVESGGVVKTVSGTEQAPIEEHPQFDELCESSPWLAARRDSQASRKVKQPESSTPLDHQEKGIS